MDRKLNRINKNLIDNGKTRKSQAVQLGKYPATMINWCMNTSLSSLMKAKLLDIEMNDFLCTEYIYIML